MIVAASCSAAREPEAAADEFATRFSAESETRVSVDVGIALFSDPGVAADTNVYDGSRRWSAVVDSPDGTRWAAICRTASPPVVGVRTRPPSRTNPRPRLSAAGAEDFVVLNDAGTFHGFPSAAAWRLLRGGAPLTVAYRDTAGVDRTLVLDLRLDTLLSAEFGAACS